MTRSRSRYRYTLWPCAGIVVARLAVDGVDAHRANQPAHALPADRHTGPVKLVTQAARARPRKPQMLLVVVAHQR